MCDQLIVYFEISMNLEKPVRVFWCFVDSTLTNYWNENIAKTVYELSIEKA